MWTWDSSKKWKIINHILYQINFRKKSFGLSFSIHPTQVIAMPGKSTSDKEIKSLDNFDLVKTVGTGTFFNVFIISTLSGCNGNLAMSLVWPPPSLPQGWHIQKWHVGLAKNPLPPHRNDEKTVQWIWAMRCIKIYIWRLILQH